MDNVGKFIFLHFEKALVGMIFIGLAYSLIWFGPWRGGKDYTAELDKLLADLEAREALNDAPQVRDLAPGVTGPEIPKQAKLPDDLIWKLVQIVEQRILPPSDVVLKSNRGYVAINWQLNPNQSPVGDAMQLLGVQVDRAVVPRQGEPGPFENRTKVAADREYMTPTELFSLAQKVAAVTRRQEQQLSRRAEGSAEGTAEAPYSIDDLFNALHDGLITQTRLFSLVSAGIRERYFTSEDRQGVTETFMGIRMMIREARGAARQVAGVQPGKRLTEDAIMKLALEQIGYKGGGKYAQLLATQEGTPGQSEGAPTGTGSSSKKPEGKTEDAGPVPVMFSEIATFVDTAANPDLEYKYRVRFWAVDKSGLAPQLRSSEFTVAAGMASPKPDTEFFLTGMLPDQGKAIILVRKWMYASNSWETKTYFVAPGEQIGTTEVIAKKDTAGRVLTENGRIVSESVDFATGCVMLDSRVRPRVRESKVSTSTYTEGNIITVDSVDYVLYDTPQIVYSDRKGTLRVKWRGSAEEM